MSGPPLIGILGGMGPAAGAAFYTRLVELTPAYRDQDHLPVVMWADPRVPDRTAALRWDGESVLPWLRRGVEALKHCGANLIVCPCNTAHVWLAEVAQDYGVELLSIIDATAEEARTSTPPGAVIGILATHATVTSGLYQEALRTRGRQPLLPEPQHQELLVRAIYLVKRASPGDLDTAARFLERVCRHLAEHGAGAVISGCTEVSLILDLFDSGVATTDSTDALARAVISRALPSRLAGVLPE